MYCIVHEAFEACACRENLGWCSNWDGILDENNVPSCRWIEDKEYADYVAEPRTGEEAPPA